jgi:hypothetical protein
MAVRPPALCAVKPAAVYPRKFLLLICTRGGVDPKAERNRAIQNPMTSPRVEPATFPLVEYYLNQETELFSIINITFLLLLFLP